MRFNFSKQKSPMPSALLAAGILTIAIIHQCAGVVLYVDPVAGFANSTDCSVQVPCISISEGRSTSLAHSYLCSIQDSPS
jgi:hypothetical protein